MSIYAGSFSVGDKDTYPSHPGIVLIRDTSDLKLGGRNDYPDPATWPHGMVDGSYIPAWCVPGHDQDETERSLGGWYRLSLFHDRTSIQAVLDEDAVRSLRDDLTEWLDIPKAQPCGRNR